MTTPETEAEILRLFHGEKWRIGTIANQLHIHHSVVRRLLEAEKNPKPPQQRARMIDPYLSFVQDTLQKYPRIPASRLFDMVAARGYPGGESHFRDQIALLRPLRKGEAFLRLKTLPGEQGQVDWAHFGRLQVGRASRPLYGFVLVLSYSRAIFLQFYLSQNLSAFLYGHENAFSWSVSMTTCAPPFWNASAWPFASSRIFSASRGTIASSRGPWRRHEETRKDAWSGLSVS